MESRDPLALSSEEVKEAAEAVNRDNNIRVVHLTIPSTASGVQGQHSVIQTSAGGLQISKNNVIVLNNKSPGVLQAGGTHTFQNIQVLDSGSGDGQYVDDGGARGRREILTRRPSYRRILNDLGGTVSEDKPDHPDQPDNNGLIKVIPASAIQLTSADGVPGMQAISAANAANAGSTIVQYTQAPDGQYYVPVSIPVSGTVKLDHETGQTMMLSASGEIIEEVTKKREVRLLKNREAAKECRRKKKEYIKCLENRVAVLENQNKALIEELKSLKELYCQKKV